VDRASIERMCAGRVPRCRHRKGSRGKVSSNTGWSGKEIWKNAMIWVEDSEK